MSLEEWLLRNEGNGPSVCGALREVLLGKTADGVKIAAKSLGAKLTCTSSKRDMVERLLAISKVGSLKGVEGTSKDHELHLSYLTDKIKTELSAMPKC